MGAKKYWPKIASLLCQWSPKHIHTEIFNNLDKCLIRAGLLVRWSKLLLEFNSMNYKYSQASIWVKNYWKKLTWPSNTPIIKLLHIPQGTFSIKKYIFNLFFSPNTKRKIIYYSRNLATINYVKTLEMTLIL